MADLSQTNSDDQEQLMEAPEAQEVAELKETVASEVANRGLSIAELMKRYHITRHIFGKRLKYLMIEPNKVGRKAYLNREQIALMDGLDKYFKEKATFEGYLDLINSTTKEQSNALSVVKPGKIGSKNSDSSVKTRKYPKSDLVNFALEDKSAVTRRMISDAAKRKIIVNTLVEKILNNPNLISEEDWEEINAVKQQFEQMLPTRQYSPEQFVERILSNL